MKLAFRSFAFRYKIHWVKGLGEGEECVEERDRMRDRMGQGEGGVWCFREWASQDATRRNASIASRPARGRRDLSSRNQHLLLDSSLSFHFVTPPLLFLLLLAGP